MGRLEFGRQGQTDGKEEFCGVLKLGAELGCTGWFRRCDTNLSAAGQDLQGYRYFFERYPLLNIALGVGFGEDDADI